MRTIYTAVILAAVLAVALLAFSFYFFEKEKHCTLFYSIDSFEKPIGCATVERYKTEDRIIYKSENIYPKQIVSKKIREKIVFKRSPFQLEKFTAAYENFGSLTDVVSIQNENDTFDFLAEVGSKFTTVSKISHSRGISVFDEESLVTYMPYLAKYNFAIGGAQFFNALYFCRPLKLLPPAKIKLIFTSIRDEYISVLGRKTKTEVLVVKAKTLPEIYIWVAKSDKTIVQLKIKSLGLTAIKTEGLNEVVIEKPIGEKKDILSQNIVFPTDNVELAGTLDMFPGDEKLPAVLLISGGGPYSMENAGLYTDISDSLARSGYAVFRFDRRGIAESQGNFMESDITNEVGDIKNALRYLLAHKRVLRNKIFIVTHGEAYSYINKLDFEEFSPRGIVMLSAAACEPFMDFESELAREEIKKLTTMDITFPDTLNSLKNESLNLVKNSKKAFALLQGKRVFLKRVSQILESDPLENYDSLNVPTLNIYGKKDKIGSLVTAAAIEKNLRKNNNKEYRIAYFRGVGYFLGEIVIKESGRLGYKVNTEVLETIRGWIKENSKDVPVEEKPDVAVSEEIPKA